jgi:hypothetical protein
MNSQIEIVTANNGLSRCIAEKMPQSCRIVVAHMHERKILHAFMARPLPAEHESIQHFGVRELRRSPD